MTAALSFEPTRRERRQLRIVPRTPIDNTIIDDDVPDDDTLGGEALAFLSLTPDELMLATDADLATSTAWLRHALGRAMDRERA